MKTIDEKLSEELNNLVQADLNSGQSVIKDIKERQDKSLEPAENAIILITKIFAKVSYYASIAENIKELILVAKELVKVMNKIESVNRKPPDIKEVLFFLITKALTEGNNSLANLYIDETPAVEMKSCFYMKNLLSQILWENKSKLLKEKAIIKLSSANYDWSDYLLYALGTNEMEKFVTASLIIKHGSKDSDREGYEKGQHILKNICYKYLEENKSEEAKKLLKSCIGSGLLDEKSIIPNTIEYFIKTQDLGGTNVILNYIVELGAEVPWNSHGTILHLFCNEFKASYDFEIKKNQKEFVENCAKLKILNDEKRGKTALSSELSKEKQDNSLIELLLNEGAIIKEQDLKYLLKIYDYHYKLQKLFIKQITKQENSKEYLNKIFLEIIKEKEQLAIELNEKTSLKSMYYACSIYENYSSKDRENDEKNASKLIKNKVIDVDLGLIELISKNGFSFKDIFFGSIFERSGVKFHELGLDIIRCLLKHTCYKQELSFGSFGFNGATLLMTQLEHPKIVIALLNANVEVITQDKFGNNVLHHLHKLKDHIVKDQLVQVCLNKEWQTNMRILSSEEKNKQGNTALINLILHEDYDGVDLLLKHGAKYDVYQIREKCKYVESSKFIELTKIFNKYSQTDSKGINHYWIDPENDVKDYISILGKNYDPEDHDDGDSSEE